MGDPISLVPDRADPGGGGALWRHWFVVLRDPEGNELCLV